MPLSVQSSVVLSRANSISVLSVAPGFPPVTVVLFAVTMNHSGKPDSAGT